MDTTIKNIKMCEKAEELYINCVDIKYGDFLRFYEWDTESIRQYRVTQRPDFNKPLLFGDDISKDKITTVYCPKKKHLIDGTYFYLRLHRQDQLQAMVKSEPYFAWNYIGMLSRWASNNITYSSSFDSMEQLWLAFVMHELYNKIWIGEEWIIKK